MSYSKSTLIVLLMLVGCQEPPGKKVNINNVMGIGTQVVRVDFEGHTYIVVRGSYVNGLCHDPDCKSCR